MKKTFMAIATGLVLAAELFVAAPAFAAELQGSYKLTCNPAPAVAWNVPSAWVTNCKRKDQSINYLTKVPKNCKQADNQNGVLTCVRW